MSTYMKAVVWLAGLLIAAAAACVLFGDTASSVTAGLVGGAVGLVSAVVTQLFTRDRDRDALEHQDRLRREQYLMEFLANRVAAYHRLNLSMTGAFPVLEATYDSDDHGDQWQRFVAETEPGVLERLSRIIVDAREVAGDLAADTLRLVEEAGRARREYDEDLAKESLRLEDEDEVPSADTSGIRAALEALHENLQTVGWEAARNLAEVRGAWAEQVGV